MKILSVLLIIVIGSVQSVCSATLDDYNQACVNGDIGGCYKLAVAYRDGEGISEDTKAAKEFFKIACDLGHAKSCNELKKNFMKHRKVEKYEKNCDQGNGEACYDLGILYNKGEIVKKEETKSKHYFVRACELKYTFGCIAMATYYKDNESINKAIEYYDKGCKCGKSKESFTSCKIAKLMKQNLQLKLNSQMLSELSELVGVQDQE